MSVELQGMLYSPQTVKRLLPKHCDCPNITPGREHENQHGEDHPQKGEQRFVSPACKLFEALEGSGDVEESLLTEYVPKVDVSQGQLKNEEKGKLFSQFLSDTEDPKANEKTPERQNRDNGRRDNAAFEEKFRVFEKFARQLRVCC